MAKTQKFFMYGTLKVGGRYSFGFDQLRKSVEKAKIKGEIYSIGGSFPGLALTEDGEVHGEIHEYDEFEKVLGRMDRIEGYMEDREESSLYKRKIVKATTDTGEIVDAIVYFMGDGLLKEAKDKYKKVETGVWEI
jgi:gamma-glutamylcyclotransferase (GGCT)/AIG2-like uncharacterized protein YtfP